MLPASLHPFGRYRPDFPVEGDFRPPHSQNFSGTCGGDAPVARGFFQNSIETGAWRQCIGFNEAAGNIFPLIYFGRSAELTFGSEEEAEVWRGPEGGTIWHIHTRQPDDYDTLVGGDPVLARKDAASRVYVFNASEHPYWLLSSFKSARAHFTDEPLFSGADSDIELELPKNRTKGKLCQKDSLDRVKRVVKVLGMVNSPDGFGDQPKVVNGFSDLMVEVFGEPIGKHARSAVGMAALPSNASVEVEMILEVE